MAKAKAKAANTKTITIDPVTRIEGHGRITIVMDEKGEVQDAHFHVTQLRGFEKLSEGRPFREMPSLMARVCGICPVSHLMASAKACDDVMAVRIPPVAADLRRVMNLAQLVQSHALSFFYLSAPDLLLGMDANPDVRNIYGVAETAPELARGGVKLRQFGQRIIEMLGGRRIHPSWVIPGGVTDPLTEETRATILGQLDEMKGYTQVAMDWFKGVLDQFSDEIANFANFPTLYMGLVTPNGELEHYDGLLRVIDADGNILSQGIEPTIYKDFIGESVEEFSYLKSPYYKPAGYPDGMMRVGPLARLAIAERAGTPLADVEMAAFKALPKEQQQSSFMFHYARLIEILYGLEKIEQLLNGPDILSNRVRATGGPNSPEGVGISEAPRGTLLHNYRVDEHGIVTWANLIIATGYNNLAMDRGVLEAAKYYVKGDKIQEGMLNRVEAVIRTFDPCLSCSTHAIGQMPLIVELARPDGEVVDTVVR